MRSPARSAGTIVAMMATIYVPAAIALSVVVDARAMVPIDPQPTPYGYTWSLLLFIVPVLVLGVWFHRHERYKIDRLDFWVSMGLLFALGAGLDIVFGTMFFTFPNEGATLGIKFPVIGGTVPIEEFGFYSFGFGAVLLTYIWCNEFWLGEYHQLVRRPRGRQRSEGNHKGSIISLNTPSAISCVLVVIGAVLWKWYGPHGTPGSFPGYFIFLFVTAILPNILFFDAVGKRINWRALCFTGFLMLPVALLWEGVLGVPYQWWGYKPEQMLGISIYGLSGLPIEEIVLWTAVSYAGIVIFETVRLWRGIEFDSAAVGDRSTPA